MQWIGTRSYGIYLWHWPVLMLLDARRPDSNAWLRSGALIVSVVAAAVTYRLIENPIRHHRRLIGSPARSLSIGAVFVVATLVTTFTLSRAMDVSRTRTGYIATTLTTPGTSTPIPTTVGAASTAPTDDTASVSGPPGTTIDPSRELLQQLETKVERELQPAIRASIANSRLPDNLEPPIEKVPDDSSHELQRGCLASIPVQYNQPCEFGDTAATTTIAIFGDSHSVQWFPALDAAGRQNRWKVLVRAKAGCPSFEVTVRKDTWQDRSLYTVCNTWRTRTIQRLIDEKVDLVVITNYAEHYTGDFTSISPDLWRRGLIETAKHLTGAGLKVLILSDTPTMRSGPTSCLSWHPTAIDQCSVARPHSIYTDIERDEAANLGLFFHDTTDWFCVDLCPLVIGNLAVYFDWAHISRTYGLFLTPYVDLLVRSVLAAPRPGTPLA
jgi:hypothetical protein